MRLPELRSGGDEDPDDGEAPSLSLDDTGGEWTSDEDDSEPEVRLPIRLLYG